jgi:putative membrane protein
MPSPNSPSPSGTINELAKERSRAAAERTLTAWIGNCLALIGFGVSFDQIAGAIRPSLPIALGLTEQSIQPLSLLFIGVGLLLLLMALVQHQIALRALEQEEYVRLPISALNRVVVAAIVLFGLVSLLQIWLF